MGTILPIFIIVFMHLESYVGLRQAEKRLGSVKNDMANQLIFVMDSLIIFRMIVEALMWSLWDSVCM